MNSVADSPSINPSVPRLYIEGWLMPRMCSYRLLPVAELSLRESHDKQD